jgi:hypothetical protein
MIFAEFFLLCFVFVFSLFAFFFFSFDTLDLPSIIVQAGFKLGIFLP